MTITELIEAGVSRIRKPIWNDTAYLRINLIEKGKPLHGPWMKLFDRPTQTAISEQTPQSLLWSDSGDDDWEEFPGYRDEADTDPEYTNPRRTPCKA